MNKKHITTHNLFFITFAIFALTLFCPHIHAAGSSVAMPKVVYITTDGRIPFWEIMGRGIQNRGASLGYEVEVLSAGNSIKRELELTVEAIKKHVDGIIVSPSTSSACATILKFAQKANIPVVISDVGTDGGEYVSYIASNNKEGAYQIGKVLAQRLKEKGWDDGRVGIVAIPQKRLNGKARTAGFREAMNEAQIRGAGMRQLVSWDEAETYRFAKEMIRIYPDLRALWLQTSNAYRGALRAIDESGKKGEMLLVAFDAEPEFLDLIPKGVIVGSAMQQPYLMGEKAMEAMHRHLSGEEVPAQVSVPILSVSSSNIREMLPMIKRNVLGIGKEHP